MLNVSTLIPAPSAHAFTSSRDGDIPFKALYSDFIIAKRCMRVVDVDRCLRACEELAERQGGGAGGGLGQVSAVNADKGFISETDIPVPPLVDSASRLKAGFGTEKRYMWRLDSLRPLVSTPKNNVIVCRCLI